MTVLSNRTALDRCLTAGGEGRCTAGSIIFDLAMRDRLLIGGMHLHFPGFARIANENGGYKLSTESWAYSL